MNLLNVNKLSVTRNGRNILDHIDLEIQAGEFVGILGPNGAGKTTLLRSALGLLPMSGFSSLASMDVRKRALHAAFMPQQREIAWPMPVETIVALGRIGHPDAARASDRQAVDRVITALRLDHLRHRAATELSGGEQARVLLARALAQETPLLVADEPIAGLDPAAQIEVMRLFQAHSVGNGAILASLHDLGLAARYCSRIILLHQGRIAAQGTPKSVMTAENLALVFGISIQVLSTAESLFLQPLETIQNPGRL